MYHRPQKPYIDPSLTLEELAALVLHSSRSYDCETAHAAFDMLVFKLQPFFQKRKIQYSVELEHLLWGVCVRYDFHYEDHGRRFMDVLMQELNEQFGISLDERESHMQYIAREAYAATGFETWRKSWTSNPERLTVDHKI